MKGVDFDFSKKVFWKKINFAFASICEAIVFIEV